ncbi:MAG TPA: hypothetical protein VHL98_14495 [Microvirga sp.]|jgi:hypothetical protein|nr:hypothetical protein [Microvirga sp.]
MTQTLNALTATLVSLAFVAALAGMTSMAADAAKAIAGAYQAPTYGSTMLFPDVEF